MFVDVIYRCYTEDALTHILSNISQRRFAKMLA